VDDPRRIAELDPELVLLVDGLGVERRDRPVPKGEAAEAPIVERELRLPRVDDERGIGEGGRAELDPPGRRVPDRREDRDRVGLEEPLVALDDLERDGNKPLRIYRTGEERGDLLAPLRDHPR
jgi:hypothetical protein